MTESQDSRAAGGRFAFECPSCGEHMQDYAERCPSCGLGLSGAYSATYTPVPTGPRRALAYLLLGVIGIGLLMGASLAWSGVGIDQLFGGG